MADRIVVMHDGIVEQIGAPLELYDRPANLFVAGFIGSPAMNFLNGTIRANGRLAFEGQRHALAAADGRPTRGRPRVIYGIRPEHFVISDDGAEAEVLVVEPTGSEHRSSPSSAARRSSRSSANATISSRATRSGSRPIRAWRTCSTRRAENVSPPDKGGTT